MHEDEDQTASQVDENTDTSIPIDEMSDGRRPQFGNRFLKDGDDVYRYNAWDNVTWDEEQEKKAKETIAKHLQSKISSSEYQDIEQNAGLYWDEFYSTHEDKFYKNRNWLFTEFPELTDNVSRTIFEIGCGVGNTVFPILQQNPDPNLQVYCCDFSATAINILRQNSLFESRCTAFVCDITQSDWNEPFEANSIDVMIMVFVLSSIPPEKMEFVLKKLYTYLKPGGVILFRDYGRYDLSQLRFKDGKCIAENYYVRGEKTLVYFFSLEELCELFNKCGYEILDKRVDQRLQCNRKKKIKMYRIWIQGKFKKPLTQ
ncbi:tRNA N(3)-methylcytidine methyltransferase METTL2 [Planococcus citri]|uniref:tRNA N(3)-methylcytidine methyltransferase METTL2 n=1 Tax=Planococcus citri TaxID=170843 RepID=UPI0031F9D44B